MVLFGLKSKKGKRLWETDHRNQFKSKQSKNRTRVALPNKRNSRRPPQSRARRNSPYLLRCKADSEGSSNRERTGGRSFPSLGKDVGPNVPALSTRGHIQGSSSAPCQSV